MTVETQQQLIRPQISRRDVAESLAGRSSGDLGVDGHLADVRCRARLLRAEPNSLQTLLVFSGTEGLLLVPYHPNPLRPVDCVMAPRDLAMATWLGTVQAPPLTVPQRANAHPPIEDEVSPRTILQEAVLGSTGIRQALSVEVHLRGKPDWQVLCVTGRTTRWGPGQLNENVKLQHGGLLVLWAMLRQVAILPSVDAPQDEFLGDATVCESLVPSTQIQDQVGGDR